MADGTKCKNCGRDVAAEALSALGEAQYGGYNPISIQYAPHWSEEEVNDFLNAYICNQCKEDRARSQA
jgi:hypothetical protein